MQWNDQSYVGSCTGADTVGIARAQLRFESSLFSFFFLRTCKAMAGAAFLSSIICDSLSPIPQPPETILIYCILDHCSATLDSIFSTGSALCCSLVAEPQNFAVAGARILFPFSYEARQQRRRGLAEKAKGVRSLSYVVAVAVVHAAHTRTARDNDDNDNAERSTSTTIESVRQYVLFFSVFS